MIFDQKLVPGKLIRRYKRFLTDVELPDGTTVVAHCTNSGSMKSCIEEGAPVYLSPAKDPKRKTRFTWEMIYMNNGWIGINTSVPNLLAFNAIKEGTIEKLKGYTIVKREVTFGDSRFDVFATNENEKCFIEVKNVTYKNGKYALFPDAVTTRGKKHLETLMEVKKQGMRAVMLYIIQRTDIEIFAPADQIDPDYSQTLRKAYENGVEIIPMIAQVSPEKINLIREMPFELQ
jgi:sugar fermentation stimulation protein A